MPSESFEISGMTCGSCVKRVRDALKNVAGVTSVLVTLKPPRAEIEMSGPVPEGVLSTAVRSAGNYTLTAERSAGSSASATAAASGQAASDVPTEASMEIADAKPSFYPLLLVVGYITGAVAFALMASGAWSWHAFMNYFMAGFFLVFSFFKLLDLPGFAGTYRSYDIVAKAWKPWGFIYPFVELALGVAYLTGWQPAITNIVTIVVMLVGSVGVLRALLIRTAIRCACLGTAIKLPMTTVTLIEDLGMAAMAIAMLIPGLLQS